MVLVAEALAAGSRLDPACQILGLSARTLQRWSTPRGIEDGRKNRVVGPSANKLTDGEEAEILATVNSAENRDLSPKQIVPKLADKGVYLASESTMYRILRREGMTTHRGRAKTPHKRTVAECVANAPNQVWSWDITYLRSPVRGRFYFLYMVLDVYSRKVMGWAIHEEESSALASELFLKICADEAIDPSSIVLRQDNGAAMKGSTLLVTLQVLGMIPSFSRPHVSNDNPFSESLFRTLKYVPNFPTQPFPSIEAARAWVTTFVRWYNGRHLHSGIQFVTPDDRYQGRDAAILAQRHATYAAAKAKHPERWAGATRNWAPTGPVRLSPTAVAV